MSRAVESYHDGSIKKAFITEASGKRKGTASGRRYSRAVCPVDERLCRTENGVSAIEMEEDTVEEAN